MNHWQRILSVHYSIPDYVRVSKECKHLLSRIFVANPEKVMPEIAASLLQVLCNIQQHIKLKILFLFLLQRITISEIRKHPWFLKNLPVEFMEGEEDSLQDNSKCEESQSTEEIVSFIQEARKSGAGPKIDGLLIGGSMDIDDSDIDDIETSGDFVCAL